MIKISLEGGTKTQRNLTEQAARFIIGELVPRKRKLELDIQIHTMEHWVGLCEHLDTNEFEINIHSKQNLYEYIATLAHELVHMKQYLRGELASDFRRMKWMGKDMTDLPYSKQPWEIEAQELQHGLAKDFIKGELDMTLKQAKTTCPRSMKVL